MPITLYSESHVGLVRKNNEDALWYDFVSKYSEGSTQNNQECAIALVSDGVGGKKYGEVASGKTVDVFKGLLADGKLKPAINTDMRAAMLDMSARRAHQEIANLSQQDPEYAGMACTLVCVMADEQQVGWVNIGDSRIYHFTLASKNADSNTAHLHQISEDQTIANALLKDGRISQQALATHPDRNTLMYCLGVEALNEPIQPQSGLFAWQPGDKLLLCSDGLTDMVNDTLIAQHMQLSSKQALKQLLQAALEAGGKDNISMCIVENKRQSNKDDS